MNSWDLNAITLKPRLPEILSSTSEARAIVLDLAAGESLSEHEVHERAWLVVVEGEIELVQDGSTETAGAGTLAVFDPAERHEVRATTDTRLLLMLAPWPGEGHYRGEQKSL